MFDQGPVSAEARGVRLAVRVQPRSSMDQVDGLERGGDGRLWVQTRVRALPDKGKANQAVIKLIAGELGLAKTTVSVLSGTTNRNKVLLIEGDSGDLVPHLTSWLEGLS